MNPIISIIVPIYNSEKYIEKCISSILNQTIKDFELILIDDGSKDKSGYICDLYAQKDSRIKVIHKENEGVASARNLGIEISSGEFIGFIDSDDYIEDDMYEILYNLINKYNSDFSACGHTTVMKSKKKIVFSDEFILCDKVNALKLFYNMKIFRWSSVDKLYRKSSLGKIRFPSINYGEDTLFILKFIHENNRFVGIENPRYNYNKTNFASATFNEFSEKNLGLLIFLKEFINILYINNINLLAKMAEAKYYERVLNYYSRAQNCKINNYKIHCKKFHIEIKKNLKLIIKNKNIKFLYKINFILFSLFPKGIGLINAYLLQYKDKKRLQNML